MFVSFRVKLFLTSDVTKGLYHVFSFLELLSRVINENVHNAIRQTCVKHDPSPSVFVSMIECTRWEAACLLL